MLNKVDRFDNYFLLGISVLCLLYFAFELYYIPNGLLSCDEFWFGHHIFQYTHFLPYRDFLPYKTVLGYYLLSLPMFFSHDILAPLYYIKDEIALINTFALALAAYWMTRFFNHKAVLLTLLLIITGHVFVIYSADLRVDAITAWLGLFSILFLLANRALFSGLMLACAFMISQKALWFFAASNIGLCAHWLFTKRDWQTIKTIALFNFSIFIFIGIYLLAWILSSDLHTVLHSVFYEGYTQAKIDWYARYILPNWSGLLKNGPIFLLLWPTTFLTLFVKPTFAQPSPFRLFGLIYASAIFIFLISYKQPFIYNMIYLVPAFFLLYADFFSWVLALKNGFICRISNRVLFYIVSFCAIFILGVTTYLRLPLAYNILLTIPLLLGLYISYQKTKELELLKLIWVLVITFGCICPLAHFMTIASVFFGSDYQQSVIRLSDALLDNSSSYFAGTPLLYNKNQTIEGLKNPIAPAIQWLYDENPKWLPVFIPSLYIVPKTQNEILQELNDHPVKFYVNNYRVAALPPRILDYLATQYEHYWASIYIYAPEIASGRQHIDIHFSGKYLIESDNNIVIDNQHYPSQSYVVLMAGNHLSKSVSDYRLKFAPEISEKMLNPAYKNDQLETMSKM
ncbi:hypothetical protein AYO45_04590 [Gammaproteobacteria bacterium SCGC AG-212-F23]|nr:hypothetical protein AYO45_04590 [Gammaproteobacteria bacterium SCGC AG-212-F23]